MNELITQFEDYLKSRLLSPHTVRNYVSDCRQFWQAAEAQGVDPLTLTRSTLFVLLADMLKKYESKTTIMRKRDSLKQFYRFLKDEKHVNRNEFEYIDRMKIERKLPPFLSQTDTAELLDSIEPSSALTGSKFLDRALTRGIKRYRSDLAEFLALRDRALIETIYGTGTRAQETANLNWVEIDFRAGFIRVNQGKGRRDRIIPITDTALEALWEYGKAYRQWFDLEPAGENPVFLSHVKTRITTRSIQRAVHLRLELAGIDKKMSTHGLRHSFATHMMQRGCDVVTIAECLGHTSLSATQKYTHVSMVEVIRDYDKGHPRA